MIHKTWWYWDAWVLCRFLLHGTVLTFLNLTFEEFGFFLKRINCFLSLPSKHIRMHLAQSILQDCSFLQLPIWSSCYESFLQVFHTNLKFLKPDYYPVPQILSDTVYNFHILLQNAQYRWTFPTIAKERFFCKFYDFFLRNNCISTT